MLHSPDHLTTTEGAAPVGLRRVTTPARLSPDHADARTLLVARESTMYDSTVLHGMTRSVTAAAARAGVRGADVLEEAVGTTVDDFLPWVRTPRGVRWRAEHDGRELREPGGRVYGHLLRLAPQTWVVVAATSATSSAAEDAVNPFTEHLRQIVEQLQPTHLWTGPASRLMRSRTHAQRLRTVVSKNLVTVHTSDAVIDFRSDPASADRLWEMCAEFSHREVVGILLRVTKGRIFRMLAGRWTEDPGSLPALHITCGADKTLVVDTSPATAAVVRALVQSCSEAARNARPLDSRAARQIARRLSEAGATNEEDGGRLDAVVDVRAAVKTRLARLVVSADGVYERLQQLPAGGWRQEDLHVPVYEDPGTGKQFVRMRWSFAPLMDAMPELEEESVEIALAWAREQLAAPAVVESHHERMPLGDVPTIVDGAPEGRTRSVLRDHDRYVVREHAVGTKPAGHGVDSTLICSLPAIRLHQAVVEAVRTAAADGRLPLDGTALAAPDPTSAADDPATRRLRRRARELHAALETEHARTDGLSDDVAELVRTDTAPRIAELVREHDHVLEQLERRGRGAGRTHAASADRIRTLAELLAVLERSKRLPPELRTLVRQHVAELRITPPSDGSPNVTGHVRLRLPTEDGLPVRTAPLPWTATSSTRGWRTEDGRVRRDRQRRIEHPNALHRRLTTDVSCAELLCTDDEQRARSNLLDLLGGRSPSYPDSGPALPGRHASALLDTGPRSTREAVYALLHADGRTPWRGRSWDDGELPTPPAVPSMIEDLDPDQSLAWLSHLRLTYLRPDPASNRAGRGWSTGGERLRRSLLLTLDAAGGEMPAEDLRQLLHLARPIRTAAEARLAFKRFEPLVVRGTTRHPTVGIRACPWCGAQDWHPLRVLDVPGKMLCGTCRRSPEVPDLVFPSSYLHDWEGPPRAGKRDLTDDRPVSVVGTSRAFSPARAIARTRREPPPVTAGTSSCAFSAGPDGPTCGQVTPTSRHKYCGRHADRSTRKREQMAARMRNRCCSRDDCDELVRYSGTGRPPKYCTSHGRSAG